MKKFALILAMILVLITAVSCRPLSTGGEGLSIVTTCFPLYDFAREIIGEKGEVTLLLQPGEESHSYEPTPQDMLTIRDADLFLCIGGESEAWVDTILKTEDLKNVTVLRLINCVTLRAIGHDHEEGDHDHSYDEHIWTSPKNAVLMVEAITDKLTALVPDMTDTFRANADAYIHELNELDAAFRQAVSEAERDTLIFGDRFPFLYFVEEYGLNYAAAYPGCAEASEPSAATVAALIAQVKEENIPIVFCCELSTGQIADTICEATGAKKLTFHSCVNRSADESRADETYLTLMQKNLTALKEALQ